MAVLRTLAAGVRRMLARRMGPRRYEAGFIPIGCDDSRVECPRAAELERHWGQAGKKQAAPSLWVTALVHLRLGVPWAWRIGKGTVSERAHREHLLPCLPPAALLVADAGYVGYPLARRLVEAKVRFLIRMSSNATLYTRARCAWSGSGRGWCTTGLGKASRRASPPCGCGSCACGPRRKSTTCGC